MGDAPAPMLIDGGDVPKRGISSGSNSGSRNKLEVLGAFSRGRLNQGREVSLVDLRAQEGPKPTGVLTGVDSRDEAARSLRLGERCNGGGLSEYSLMNPGY